MAARQGRDPLGLLRQAARTCAWTASDQVMLAWMMNDKPLTPQHGAPMRLVVPFRYGARSIKAITDISLGSTGMPSMPLPAA